MKLMQTEKTFAIAASKAGMDEKTARKYRDLGKLPSQCRTVHRRVQQCRPNEQEAERL